MKCYSYIVDHDYGYAPNPQGGICSLVQCKFQGHSRNRNIVELADISDVIIGTGGAGTCSTGRGTLLYIMKVTDKIPFTEYLTSRHFRNRVDCHDKGYGNQFALISNQYVYLGENAINIDLLPKRYWGIEKKGPWFKNLIPSTIGDDLLDLLIKRFGRGMNGRPKCNEYSMRPTKRCSRPAKPAADR